MVFESGMGASGSMWGAVLPGIAARTRAVAYDRAGLGRSDPDPQPRTLARMTDDLVALLEHLGDDHYVLVGHSWGGPIVRTTAARRPELIAGLVLVDASDERMELFDSPAVRKQRERTVKDLFFDAFPAPAQITAVCPPTPNWDVVSFYAPRTRTLSVLARPPGPGNPAGNFHLSLAANSAQCP